MIQSLYESSNLDKNNKEMIGDDMVISYKVNTNFIKKIVKSYLTTMWLLSGNKKSFISTQRVGNKP